MTTFPLAGVEEDAESLTSWALSHSRINRYLTCPEQYRLHYVENLRPRYPNANLAFGQVVHKALAALFRGGEDPVKHFTECWATLREIDLSYAKRDSWEKFLASGQALLDLFVRETASRLTNITAVEKSFEIVVTRLGQPLVGIVDLVADLDGKKTVVDFKTASSTYKPHEVILADQLTAYALAEPEAVQIAFCVLVKTKTPKVDWYVSARTSDQIAEYIDKAGLVAANIASGRFYKRPGTWCSWCDFLPICLGDQQKVDETLIQIR
jgi:RecB family exonuclease